MPKISLEEVVAKVERLPQLPQSAMRVSRMLEEEDINAEKLAEVIRLDSGFTTQVLKLCNSAAYGFSRKIFTVKDAIAILGLKTLKSMVYTILAKMALDRPVAGYALKEGELWYNALTCAIYAKHIAQQEKLPDPEVAFTAGLLRDIGKIVMGEYVGINYSEIEQLTIKERIDFLDAEERVTGFNHSTLGIRLAEKWSLPSLLALTIGYHHKPGSLPPETQLEEAKLVSVIHLADLLSRMIGQGSGSDGLMYCLDVNTLAQVGIDVQGGYMEEMLGQLVDLNPIIQDLAESMSA